MTMTEIRKCHKCGTKTAMEDTEGRPLCPKCFDQRPLASTGTGLRRGPPSN